MQVNALGERVKKLRLKKGQSLNIFCFENDINKATLSNIETGKNTNPKLGVLIKISKGLDISLSKLFDYP